MYSSIVCETKDEPKSRSNRHDNSVGTQRKRGDATPPALRYFSLSNGNNKKNLFFSLMYAEKLLT